MQIGNTNIKNELFFVIEEGQYNLGSFNKALQMIEMAGLTGASAIEFQLAYADDFYIKSEAGHGIYKTREFSDDQLKELVAASKAANLEFVATCLSQRLVGKMASFGASAYNLNASDINNTLILDAILETGLPFFVSLPLAYEKEVDWVVGKIRDKKPEASFALLHGQHPMASGKEWVDMCDTSLGYLRTINAKYNCPAGFIDHSAQVWSPAVAVAAGAQIISKHMAPSSLFRGPDWAICLEPAQMKQAVTMARDVWQSMQITDKQLAKGEDLDRSVMRRSIVAATDLKKGSVIDWSALNFKRPGTGIAPDEADSLIGKTLTADVAADTLLEKNMFN